MSSTLPAVMHAAVKPSSRSSWVGLGLGLGLGLALGLGLKLELGLGLGLEPSSRASG